MISMGDQLTIGGFTMTSQQSSTSAEPVHTYPGGQDAPAYRWVFTAWVVLFLGVLCMGLLNYLGIYAKKWWPDL